MNEPLVSVIVPTKNSAELLSKCLKSIVDQTYKNIELIVVDNYSTDTTHNIAKDYGATVYIQGPERSAQVNYGVKMASGQFIYKVDSDFVLNSKVIQECVSKVTEGFDAVVVHNSPDVRVSWIARVRKFEVDMYKYDITHSSARFVKRSVYLDVGGFNPAITAGEDYDFQNKLNRNLYKTGFIEAEALHLGEPKKLLPHLKKYFEYGKDFIHYYESNQVESTKQLSFLRNVYIKHWTSFIKHPITASTFIVYNLLKYAAGGSGLLYARLMLNSKKTNAKDKVKEQ